MNLDFTKMGGLIPAVVQDVSDGEVLMVGFMNEESFNKTVETGKVTFFSRSRNELWPKGQPRDIICWRKRFGSTATMTA